MGEFFQKFRNFLPNDWVNSFWHWPRAVLANIFYGFPSYSLKIIGVTGTDGKTTTASLIHQIFLENNEKSALVSTVGAKFGGREVSTGLHVTSPDAFRLQRLLKEISQEGMKYLVLETTSHGLVQHRFWGINFEIGVITNVTPEHLDYHEGFDKYLMAKARLFKKVKVAILNKDDMSFDFLKNSLKKGTRLVTYSLRKEADFNLKKFAFKTSLPGEYNLYNCLAAIATAKCLGLSDEKIRSVLTSFVPVKGRMEEIKLGQDFRVIIDFAHTPNALENVLRFLRINLKGRLILVFGCAGLRDQKKRPLMGQTASFLADIVILTAEDPRMESVEEIIDQISRGCLKEGMKEARYQKGEGIAGGKFFLRIPDRKEAIEMAINRIAKKDDVVIICGKGHEKSMCYGSEERPWSEHQVVRQALKKRLEKNA